MSSLCFPGYVDSECHGEVTHNGLHSQEADQANVYTQW